MQCISYQLRGIRNNVGMLVAAIAAVDYVMHTVIRT